MTDLLSITEQNLQKFYSAHLPIIIQVQGVYADHYKKLPSKEDSVYGSNSGLDPNSVPTNENIKILVSSFQWRVLTDYDGSYLDDIGYMYTLVKVNPGDYIKFKRLDNIEQGLIVSYSETIGLTTNPITRFKISNVSE